MFHSNGTEIVPQGLYTVRELLDMVEKDENPANLLSQSPKSLRIFLTNKKSKVIASLSEYNKGVFRMNNINVNTSVNKILKRIQYKLDQIEVTGNVMQEQDVMYIGSKTSANSVTGNVMREEDDVMYVGSKTAANTASASRNLLREDVMFIGCKTPNNIDLKCPYSTMFYVDPQKSENCVHRLSAESLQLIWSKSEKYRNMCPVVGCDKVWRRKTSSPDIDLQMRVRKHLTSTGRGKKRKLVMDLVSDDELEK